MPQPEKPKEDRPDPIEASLHRAEEEREDASTNRRWFWRFLLPFIVFFLLSMAYVLWQALQAH